MNLFHKAKKISEEREEVWEARDGAHSVKSHWLMVH